MRLKSIILSAGLALIGLSANAAERPPEAPTDNYVGMAFPWQMNFQQAVTPVMERMYNLHEFLLIVMALISLFVLGLLAYVCMRFRQKANPVASKNSHNTAIEIIWTVVPIVILAAIFIPSYRLHYDCVHNIGCTEDGVPVEPDITLKVIGYQWYWNYEYPGLDVRFDSYMKQDPDLLAGEPRLLAVDNPVVVPKGANVRVLVTGGDVIHSWAMPAFGVKQDTVPGRLNETWFRADKEGTYYGQCSELCGRLHGFMPIQVEVVSEDVYDQWAKAAAEDVEAASELIAKLRGRTAERNVAELQATQ